MCWNPQSDPNQVHDHSYNPNNIISMECSFCHNYLTALESNQSYILKLCCSVNQIFCFHCLFNPSIIQLSILNNYEWKCQECQCRVEEAALWRKRLGVDLGPRSSIDGRNERGGFKAGYTFFSRNDGMRNPESSTKASKYFNYGAKFEIQSMSSKKSLFDTKNWTQNSAHKSLYVSNSYREVTPPKKTSFSQQEHNSIIWSAQK